MTINLQNVVDDCCSGSRELQMLINVKTESDGMTVSDGRTRNDERTVSDERTVIDGKTVRTKHGFVLISFPRLARKLPPSFPLRSLDVLHRP